MFVRCPCPAHSKTLIPDLSLRRHTETHRHAVSLARQATKCIPSEGLLQAPPAGLLPSTDVCAAVVAGVGVGEIACELVLGEGGREGVRENTACAIAWCRVPQSHQSSRLTVSMSACVCVCVCERVLYVCVCVRGGWVWGHIMSSPCMLGYVLKDVRCVCVCVRSIGQNHIYTVYAQYFRQGIHQIYSHIRCIYSDLANPMCV
jgi:hypothetical protein